VLQVHLEAIQCRADAGPGPNFRLLLN
jgi:hypothetical protein